jgi:hypothetical protein
MNFEVIGAIRAIETIAEGSGIRELARLRKCYGMGNWKKKKGMGCVRLFHTSEVLDAELHWYEAHGRGKFEIKIKRFL